MKASSHELAKLERANSGMYSGGASNGIRTNKSFTERASESQAGGTTRVRPAEIDMSLYDRNRKINRIRTNILQTSLMVPFKGNPAGWGTKPRFTRSFQTAHKFMTVKPFYEEALGTVKFSRAPRFKEHDFGETAQAPGPGHYGKTDEDGRFRGPVYAFSICARDTAGALTGVGPVDREWKEKLGPGCYDAKHDTHVVCTKISKIPREIDIGGTGTEVASRPNIAPGKYRVECDWHVPSIHMPLNECMAHPLKAGEDVFIQKNTKVPTRVDQQAKMSQTARSHREHVEKVRKAGSKMREDKLARKQELSGKWERIRAENQRVQGEQTLQRELRERRAKLWLERIAIMRRVSMLGKVLVYTRWENKVHRIQDHAARRIQKVGRMYIGWRRTMQDAKMTALRRRVEKFLFQRLFARRIDRRQKAAAAIYQYCEEIREAEGLRTVCQRFRLSVIKAQRVVRNFLAIRKTQVEVMVALWDRKEEKLKNIAENKDVEKNKGKKPRKPAKGKGKGNWNYVPEDVKLDLVRKDIRERRKAFELEKDDMMRKAEVQMAKNLIAGEEVRAKSIEFRFLPSEERVFALIREGQEIATSRKGE